MALLCIGASGLFALNGTYATFNATTTSTSNAFQSAAMLMSNGGTSPCTAVSSGNCGTIQLSSNSGMSPGDIGTGTITITNAGSVPATMALIASKNAGTSANFDTDLNLTIHDDTTGFCIYGSSQSLPFDGSCDSLNGLTSQASADAFPSGSTATLALPGAAGSGQPWAAAEAHSLTVTVEVLNSVSVPTGSTGALDLSWTGTSVAGTSH